MRKSLILAFFIASVFLFASAQSEVPVVVISVQGKLMYNSPGSTAGGEVGAGAVLKKAGSVMPDNAKSGSLLLSGYLFKTVKGKKLIGLETLFPKDQAAVGLNFDRTVADYIQAAISLGANPESPQDAWGNLAGKTGKGDGWGNLAGKTGKGDGWGNLAGKTGKGDGWGNLAGKTGKGDGWGGKGTSIYAVKPFGKLTDTKTLFTWSKPAGDNTYQLSIKNEAGETVFNGSTKDTFLYVTLDPKVFISDKQYKWQIQSGKQVSSYLVFEMSSPEGLNKAVQRATGSPLFASSGKDVQGIIKAVSLEYDDFYADAARTYAELQKSYPNNDLIKLMHATFWTRYGLKALAISAFKGN